MSSMEAIAHRRRLAALEEIDSLGYFKSIRWLDETDSTNRQLSEEIRSGEILSPAILIADRQSGGKGRGGNQWFSPSGCLMFSMAIPLERTLSDDEGSVREPNVLLPLEVGVAVAQSLAPMTQYRPQVKWPNDVYVQERKVCGVLIEVVQGIAIIGIGINCQVDFSDAMPEVQERATSVHLVSNRTPAECSPEDVLVQFIQTWLSIEACSASNPDWLLECWKDWSFLEGKWVTIEKATSVGPPLATLGPNSVAKASHSIEGMCLGINQFGELLVAMANGHVAPIIAGTVANYRDA